MKHTYKSVLQVVLNTAFFCFLFFVIASCGKEIETSPINFKVEQIPGSKNHSPNGTWWGYNQSKIVRFGNTVYMYVIDNQNIDINPNPNASNPSKIVLYRKEDDNSWQKGASFNTSRPGNILMDSEGIVHLIVFEPTYTQSFENGAYGKLLHYWFPNCKTGDISIFNQEIIVDNDGVSQGETVNMRVGASIGDDDMISVSFGLNKGHQIYYKEKNGIKWQMEYAWQNLNSDVYYPYVISTDFGLGILAIQDNFVGENMPNIYQKIFYFERKSGIWTPETIIDLQNNALASTRPQLVENCDIFQDRNKQIHLLYQTRLNPADPWLNTFYLATQTISGWEHKEISISEESTNWLRMIEIQGTQYFLCTSWDKLYVKKGIDGQFYEIPIPKMSGIYVYINSPRGGTKTNENFIDILLLNGNSNDYPNAKNYYLRIEKSEFLKL
ncbi:MAG: hypothetical protein Q7J34_02005 [Bacteroidales bacterium]|nr:hypothetical protein [Bacteroidales bacterium]